MAGNIVMMLFSGDSDTPYAEIPMIGAFEAQDQLKALEAQADHTDAIVLVQCRVVPLRPANEEPESEVDNDDAGSSEED